MSRRPTRLTALAATLVLVAACGGSSAPALTDPVDILVKSIESLQAAKSFHVDVAVTGTISADPTGTGGSTSFTLDGTSAAADVDIAGKAVRATFSVPALLGLAGELIAVDDSAYVKTTLTGALFQKSSMTDAGLPADPGDVADLDLTELRAALARPEVAPTKGDDVRCGAKDCYTVTIELTAEEIASLSGGALPDEGLPIDVGSVGLTVTFRVEKDTLRPAGIGLTATMGPAGSLSVDLTMSKWDENLSISAPPADQVAP
jgi:hypothetical protein